MSYAESYVTTGAGASDLNGGGPQLGALDGPIYAAVGVDSTQEIFPYYILSDSAGSPWPGVQVGDQLCYDPAGTKVFARVVEVNYFGVPNDIRVYGTTGELTGKACNVGGAFATPKAAVAAIETMQAAFADGTPPRLNIKGDHTIDATITPTVSWTKYKPLIIQGYTTTPGDRPATRPILTVNSNINLFWTLSWDLMFVDLHFRRTDNSAAILINLNSRRGTFLRCRFEATSGSGTLLQEPQVGLLVNCEFAKSGVAAGSNLVNFTPVCIGCLFENGQIYGMQSTLVGCRLKNVFIPGARYSSGIVNCLIEPPAATNAYSITAADTNLVYVINSIIQGVSGVGKAAIVSNVANFGLCLEAYNDFWNNTATYLNIVNPIDAQGDIATDPNLDANDRPQAGSGALGAGTPSYIDIGWGQKQETGGGGGMLVHPGTAGGARG